VSIWYNFAVLASWTMKNLATLESRNTEEKEESKKEEIGQ
jgi:hypothetical protein